MWGTRIDGNATNAIQMFPGTFIVEFVGEFRLADFVEVDVAAVSQTEFRAARENEGQIGRDMGAAVRHVAAEERHGRVDQRSAGVACFDESIEEAAEQFDVVNVTANEFLVLFVR